MKDPVRFDLGFGAVFVEVLSQFLSELSLRDRAKIHCYSFPAALGQS